MEGSKAEAGHPGLDAKAPRVIGVTGGIGSGKSRILAILEQEHKAWAILADQVAAKLEEPGGPALEKLVGRFGSGILDEGKGLDREAFAQRIFQDRKALEEVNAIVHPLVWKEIWRMVRQSSHPLVVVESALFDEESRKICDELWFVDATKENRAARLMAGRGYTREKCYAIMENQPGREYFLDLADAVIDNNGSMEETSRQVGRLLAWGKQR